ncbi:hypothetical protein DH2020_019484 [Rehmannia glutinosa]|uniref:Uncharacterized protein n=1 Tax=Rehmannia glutinosa TaxID=99300 RepID=A0ABR0WQG5_REHGL
MVMTVNDRSEIAFFDVETTVPTRTGQGFAILEFEQFWFAPGSLWSSEVTPPWSDPPTFPILHLFQSAAMALLRTPLFRRPLLLILLIWFTTSSKAFAEINRPAPEPKGTIDSLALLTQKFGRRAGDMKESSLPDIFTENSWVSPNATTRSRSDGKISKEQTAQNESTPSSSIIVENHSTSSPPHHMEGNHPILLLMSPNTGEVNLSLIESNPARADPLKLSALAVEIEKEPLLEDNMEEEKTDSTSQESSTAVGYGHPNGCNDFLEPDDISIPSISILETTDSLAKKLSIDSGSSSEWRPVVIRKRGFFNSPILRLHLPTVADGETTRCATEIYQKDSSATQRIVFRRFDVNELDSLFTPGNIMDACFSLDVYDYQQNAGIRLVAKKLTVHSS